MGCATGCFATAILVLNNLRDLDTDFAAGKLTLATRIGSGPTRALLLGLVCTAFAIPALLVILALAPVTALLALLVIPVAAAPVRIAFDTKAAPALVPALKRMATTELAYALLFSLGLLL
jgi:1,4-dihydroxy-2-naphthoate octaprenyltransferase